MRKRFIRVLLAGLIALSPIVPVLVAVVAPLVATLLNTQKVYAVTRQLYWVGGTATWDTTAGNKWSLSSGGAGGEAIPDSDDNVFFDAASGAVTVTITWDVNCLDFNTTGFTGTLVGSNGQINVYGSLFIDTVTTITTTFRIVFKATTTGKTIATNGESFYAFTFSGVGGEWTLQDNITFSVGGINVSNGSLITNNKTITMGYAGTFAMSVGSCTLGTSIINISGNASLWDISGGTLSAASSTVNLAWGDNNHFYGGGKTYGTVNITGGSTNPVIRNFTGANTFTNLSIVSGNTAYGIYFSADQVITGTLTLTGYNSSTKRLLVCSNVLGTSRQLTAAAVSINNCNLRDIAAGNPTWDISAGKNSDYGGNYGITFTTPIYNYWVGNSGSWSAVTHWASTATGTGGTGRVPIPQDIAVFTAYSFGIANRTVTMDVTDICSINATQALYTPTFTSSVGTLNTYGNLDLGTVVWNPAITFKNRLGISTITTISTLVEAVAVDTMNQVVYFQSNAVLSSSLTLTSGYLNLFGYSVTAASFDSSTDTYERHFLMGAGTLTLNSTAAVTKWHVHQTNYTQYCETSTIVLTSTGANDQTFSPGTGQTFRSITIGGTGNYALTIDEATTIYTLTIDRSAAAKTVRFPTAKTVTITGDFFIPTAGTTVVTMYGTTAPPTTSVWIISKATGAVSTNWVSLEDSTASGGASFYAGANSTFVSHVTGWLLQNAPFPTVTTLTATDIRVNFAVLNGQVTSMGGASTVYAFFQYGTTNVYGANTTEQPMTTTGVYDDGVNLTPATWHFRAAVRYGTGASYVYGNDAVFNVTRMAAATPAVGGTNPFFEIPENIPHLYTEGDYSKVPGAGIINKVLDDSEVPYALWWYLFIDLSCCIIGLLTYGATRLNGGPGSLFLQAIVMVIYLSVWSVLGVVPFNQVILFMIPVLAFNLKQNHFSWG